jgi:hypothetical protein
MTIVGLKILFVDLPDRFPVQIKMLGHLGDCHHFAEAMKIRCQPLGSSQIRVKKLKLLDTDALAIGTHELAIFTVNPDLRSGQIQIPDGALSPTVNGLYFLSA